MKVQVREYSPFADIPGVLKAWEAALGGAYPVSERVFASRAGGTPGWQPGDALVACAGRRIVGFGLAEIVRTSLGATGGSIAALLVAPDCQRQGIGSQLLRGLEARLRKAGCKSAGAGAGPQRFWTGVPENLPAAKAFLARHGYASTRRSPDMLMPLENCSLEGRYQAALDAAGCRVVAASADDAGALLSFEAREFKGWCANLIQLMSAGDVANILLVKHGAEIVGSITAFTPGSRWRGANVVWERVHGAGMGGYGAVGIAKEWRGKGLGAAMNIAAALHVRRHGATCCYIDWVGPVEFYEKLGARVWRWFDMMGKELAPPPALT